MTQSDVTNSYILDLLKGMKEELGGLSKGVEHLTTEVLSQGARLSRAEERIREHTETMSTLAYERDSFQKSVMIHMDKFSRGIAGEIAQLKQNDEVQNVELAKQTKALGALLRADEEKRNRESILADLIKQRNEEQKRDQEETSKKQARYLAWGGLGIAAVELLSKFIHLGGH